MSGPYRVKVSDWRMPRWRSGSASALFLVLLVFWIAFTPPKPVSAQSAPTPRYEVVTIQGTVLDLDGRPVFDALVRLEHKGNFAVSQTKTDAAGTFIFSKIETGSYQLNAEKAALRSPSATVAATLQESQTRYTLILQSADQKVQPSPASNEAMEFADKPTFSVAGVTDWTAAGGHGSDSTLRTSEALASETSKLKAGRAVDDASTGPDAFHRATGERAEKQGDPLSAVREFEQATRLVPSEENYFTWGSELLLHRAVVQAEQVLHKGADLYPKSARMLTGLSAALFAGARYEEAAAHLCTASDLNPADPWPYLFMGRIEIAAPAPLPCVEQKLARFIQLRPLASLANYFYAMAILKRQQQPVDQSATRQAESLLTKAITLDTKCSDGYLQLGIMAASRRDYPRAIDFYVKAIGANPQMGDAHYRLGVAYDRIGKPEQAKLEFELHDKLKQKDAEEIERQRLEVKQFMIVQPGQPTFPSAK